MKYGCALPGSREKIKFLHRNGKKKMKIFDLGFKIGILYQVDSNFK